MLELREVGGTVDVVDFHQVASEEFAPFFELRWLAKQFFETERMNYVFGGSGWWRSWHSRCLLSPYDHIWASHTKTHKVDSKGSLRKKGHVVRGADANV
jgi:hypothetical protein